MQVSSILLVEHIVDVFGLGGQRHDLYIVIVQLDRHSWRLMLKWHLLLPILMLRINGHSALPIRKSARVVVRAVSRVCRAMLMASHFIELHDKARRIL